MELRLTLHWPAEPTTEIDALLGGTNDTAAATFEAELTAAKDAVVAGPQGVVVRRIAEALTAAKDELATAQKAADAADALFSESLLSGSVNVDAETAASTALDNIARLERRIPRLETELATNRAKLEQLAADAVDKRLAELADSTENEFQLISTQMTKLLDPLRERAAYVAAIAKLANNSVPAVHDHRENIKACAARVKHNAA